ncbi:glycosyltransferase [Photobacterium damselae]|uniref:glycosyltransferase n=1 Tax=Photobacterium damselae TaxID=38293 RepID=UPI002542A215
MNKLCWILPPVRNFNSGVYLYNKEIISILKKDNNIDIKEINLPGNKLRYIYQFLYLPLYIILNHKKYSYFIYYDESISFLNLFSLGKSVQIIHDIRFIKAHTFKEFLKKIYMCINNKFLFLAYKKVVVSKFTGELLNKLGGSYDMVVYNPIVGLEEIDESNVREDIINIFSQGKKIILNVGSHESRKNISKIVEVVSLLGDDFIFVQAGRPIDLTMFNYNKNKALESGCCFYFLNEINRDELSYLYKNSFSFICLSSFEGFGRTPIEAQVYSLPVITTINGGLSEAVLDSAFVVSIDDDIHALTKKIKLFLSSDDEINVVVNKGIVNSMRFSAEDISNKFKSVIL